MATSSITANFYCDDAKAANAFVRMLAQPVRTVVRKKRSQTVVNDTTVDDADAFVKRFKALLLHNSAQTRRRNTLMHPTESKSRALKVKEN